MIGAGAKETRFGVVDHMDGSLGGNIAIVCPRRKPSAPNCVGNNLHLINSRPQGLQSRLRERGGDAPRVVFVGEIVIDKTNVCREFVGGG